MTNRIKEYFFNANDGKNLRSIRKVLALALYKTTASAKETTGRSINDLPEYFLSVKTAEFIHKHYDTFTFSMEDSISTLIKDIGMPEGHASLTRKNGNVDLIIRGKRQTQVKHLVEFKRGFKEENHLKDIIRLAEFCRFSPYGHKTEKNFMVMVAPVSAQQMKDRHYLIEQYLYEIFHNRIGVSVEYVDLSDHLSTRATKLKCKPLFGAVCELKYVD